MESLFTGNSFPVAVSSNCNCYLSPVMRIEEKTLKYWIDHFYGYGSWQAKIWFVSYEEGGGDLPEEVAEKLNYFYNIHTADSNSNLCDIRELYEQVTFRADGPKGDLFANLYEYRFGNGAMQNSIWKNLIAFTHGYYNRKLPDLFDYQKNVFAVPTLHQEALIPLYPLPSPHNHAWYYSWLDLPQFGFLKSRKLYEEHVYPNRVRTLFQNMSLYKPKAVVMYGMDNINLLKKSIQDFFGDVKFKMVKATKQQIPQHHRAEINETTLVITTQIPALRHNRVATGFDWQEFGKTVKSMS
jgi:hypothetical protein